MKNLKIILTVLFITLLILFAFISTKQQSQTSTKPIIGATTFALYDATKYIAGETCKVVNILPFGVDPHSFEPTPKLMVNIEKSALVFYSGAGLEPWVQNFDFKGKAVDLSKYVHLRKLEQHSEDEEEHHSEHADKHEHHQHHHNGIDPHYWLDFNNMKIISTVITEKLIALLPQNRALYMNNRDAYIKKLDKLNLAYQTQLSGCKNDTVVVSHNALGYIADKYGFHVESLTGLSPEAQPSAQDINRVFNGIKEHGIDTIFFENFVNDKLIKSIAHDAGISFDVFEPLGNITADEAKAGKSYEDIMYENLKKLRKALQCQ
ncbi:metal ABC transporter substrate-binding protein [Sulfurimonas sp.]|uniref:metal ABC transporter substrate-binding protein n=1 Tax=Sulfurimonas sp. TaxID=2022749 RepID=UPI002601941C|nr:metal ABC transporter substrate-binding protein [Sulfurimonas sp.]